MHRIGIGNMGYRGALFFLCVSFIWLTWPFWRSGEVVAPFRQYAELAAVDQSGAKQLENRKFSDFSLVYIPEIIAHLNAPRSGWLALWSDKNELGRPLGHGAWFSPAYPPSWLLSLVTNNPWRFITILSLAISFLSGLFILLWAREMGLAPLAGLLSGAGLMASPQVMYWLTFPMFTSVYCWSAGALWAVTRLAKRRDLLSWSALAFSGYSLLMTAYPQSVVYHAYLLGGYGFWLGCRQANLSRQAGLKFLALAVSAVLVGAAAALPVYLDLAGTFSESARVAPDLSFFTSVVLPKFAGFSEALRFFALILAPELFGNPIAPQFPFAYDSLSVTPIVIFFAAIALEAGFRKTWGGGWRFLYFAS